MIHDVINRYGTDIKQKEMSCLDDRAGNIMSMEQVSDNNNKTLWFELYTSFYKLREVIKLLDTYCDEYFLPMHTENIVCGNKKIHKRVPSIPCTVFVRTSKERIKKFIAVHSSAGLRLRRCGNVNGPLIIADDIMHNLIDFYRNNGNEISYTEIRNILR